MNIIAERFLEVLTTVIEEIHQSISTAKRNRYKLREDLYIWYDNGKLTYLHTDKVSLDLIQFKSIKHNLGPLSFYVDITHQFKMRIALHYGITLQQVEQTIDAGLIYIFQEIYNDHINH